MPRQEFFKEKKQWSKVKDDLFSYYLKLYFSKILRTGKPTVLIDGFAGKGKFDDDNDGSPIIALNIAKDVIEACKGRHMGIDCHFIEKKYASDLKNNLSDYKCNIYDGSYGQFFTKILESVSDKNIFVYIDPFGIKHIQFDKFKAMSSSGAASCELLLNLNSFGFIREAIRLLKAKPLEDDIPEMDDAFEDSDVNDIDNMNNVANGDYWQKIITDYNVGIVNGYEAEESFVTEYCNQLRTIFDYVLEVPIKVKMKNHPKYRMVYATNHPHGYIEMADNMNKRWETIKHLSQGGQMTLFEIGYMNNIFEKNIDEVIIKHMPKSYISYSDYLCTLIKNEGIFFSKSEINQAIKDAEKNGTIEILRCPPATPTGRKATWVDYKKDMKVRMKNGN